MNLLRPLPHFLIFVVILLLIDRLILATREPADPYRPAGHDDYMRDEYGDLYREFTIENWIDYWEGYITG